MKSECITIAHRITIPLGQIDIIQVCRFNLQMLCLHIYYYITVPYVYLICVHPIGFVLSLCRFLLSIVQLL